MLKNRRHYRKRIILLVLGIAFHHLTMATAAENSAIAIRCNPENVLGVKSCAKCHENELAQWKQTPHAKLFETLHRNPEAKEITERLGYSSVKRNETCIKCHYTQQNVNGRLRVVSGVSCESCHGAAKNWIALHNDYGGPNATKESESEEHRQERLALSISAGMNNPSNLYLVARQCLSCHTTPDEELVNIGGHNPGSKDFELVAWSQGMIRHNFLRTGGNSNGQLSQEQLRVMYVVGVMADLEASLRATAQATKKDRFGIASAQRAARLKHRIYNISQKIEDPYVQQAVDAALAVPLKLNRADALTAAADTVGEAARAFADEASGSDLAALDSLLPDPSNYKQLQ